MLKSGKRIKHKRAFSEDFKLRIIREYESGQHSISQIGKNYDITVQNIYRWIYKYSKYNKQSIQIVEFKDSEMNRIKLMEKRIAELERALGQKQMNIDYLEKMIDLAKDEYEIDIKKNSNTPHSGGSKITKKN